MRLILLVFLITSITGLAQEPCDANLYFEKTTCSLVVEKCVILKANIDPNGKKFIYQWSTGDGKTAQGSTIEHCYDTLGTYSVSLDLIEPKTNFRITDEVKKTLVIKSLPEIVPDDKIIIGKEASFSYTYDLPDEMMLTEIFWSYGDGTYSCGKQGRHMYYLSGQFEVRVLLVGLLNEEEVQICGTISTEVKDGNINGHPFVDLFEVKEKEQKPGRRFLEDPIHMVISPTDNKQPPTVIDIERKSHYAEVALGTSYSVFAFKGNLFVGPVYFQSGTPSEVDNNLSDAINQLALKKVEMIESVSFDLDSYDITENSLSGSIDLARKVPYIQFAIGVYTHTGGKTERNQQLSDLRGNKLVSLLVKSGIPNDRISIFTAREDSRLNNTCSGIQPCNIEDPYYNGKCEIKLVLNN